MSYLSEHLTPLSEPYNRTLSAIEHGIEATGATTAYATQAATGHILQELTLQSHVLAYIDVFTLCGIAAFLIAPLSFLFSPAKGGSKGPPAH